MDVGSVCAQDLYRVWSSEELSVTVYFLNAAPLCISHPSFNVR